MFYEEITQLKEQSIDLIVSDLDGTLVKNIPLFYFKKGFFKHPFKNLTFLTTAFYQLLRFSYEQSCTFIDFKVNLFKTYVEHYSSLYEILDFVKNNKDKIILKDAQEFLNNFTNAKKILVTCDFKELAYLFKDDFQLDEIYADLLDKREVTEKIMLKNYRSALVLGDSKKDLELALALQKEGIEPILFLRTKRKLEDYVNHNLKHFYSFEEFKS